MRQRLLHIQQDEMPKFMDAAETNAIAKLPNREGMLSMFAGALTSTLSGLAVAMQAYADKQEEPAA